MNQIVEKEVEEYVDVPVGRVVYNDKVVEEVMILSLFLSFSLSLSLCLTLNSKPRKLDIYI